MAWRIHSLEASRPWAMTASVTFGAPSSNLANAPSVPPASTITRAMSPLTSRPAQRAVGEPAGQDAGVAGLALAAEERAGDLAGGVHALFEVDGQREEVGALAHAPGGGGGDEDLGVADADGNGAVGLEGESAR